MTTEPQQAGIGVFLSVSHGHPASFTVGSLEEGGAAALSGMVKVGDEVLAIDKQKLSGLSQEQAQGLCLGEEGSLTRIRVRRRGNITFDVCLERASCRQQKPPSRPAKPRDAEVVPEQPRGAVEKIYAGMAKLNQAIERAPSPAKLTVDELKVFRERQDEEVRQLQAQAQREHDTQRRRNAEINVLRREMKEMHRAGAPFFQMLEYQNWIKRLQYEEHYENPEELKALEMQAEEQELQERVEQLTLTLELLQSDAQHRHPDGEASCEGGRQSEEDVVKGKIDNAKAALEGLQRRREGGGEDRAGKRRTKSKRRKEHSQRVALGPEQTLRQVEEGRDQGRHAQADSGGVEGHEVDRAHVTDATALSAARRDEETPVSGGAHTACLGDVTAETVSSPAKEKEKEKDAAGKSGAGVGLGEGIRRGGRGEGRARAAGKTTSVTASVAAELRTRWVDKGPREGVLASEEGRLQEAPQPCMLIQSTSAAVKDLWPGTTSH